jgi:hypothetical protein
MQSFIDYVYNFYGKHGIYGMNATRTMICNATNKHINQIGGLVNFGYDSTDREAIRDILIEDYALIWPE